jgi:ribosome biogenesis protein ENP2
MFFSLQALPNLLKDDRFSALFTNPDFEVDTESPDYRLLNPVVSKLDKQRMKKKKQEEADMEMDEVHLYEFYAEFPTCTSVSFRHF